MSGMWYGWVLWLVILIVIVWMIVNQLNKNKQDSQLAQSDYALEMLNKRYVKGEITKEKFKQMKKELK